MFGLDSSDMLFRIPALLAALTVHEYAHARVADYLGDPTPAREERLTLNPIAHLDPVGLLMLWLFQFGWAKPVPVNPYCFRNGRNGMMMVAFAGPASNILLALASALTLGLMSKFHVDSFAVEQVLWLLYSYNIMFAIFNLLPFPPLDGSKIVAALLPGKAAELYERLTPIAPFLLIALIYLGVIRAIAYPLQRMVSMVIQTIVAVLL
ncbi:MAG: site-2 protease family protein [Sporomusaceae bacterium]|nr:site-2 protease family protein [Sporomusaceae bacterium]